ncbi:MAG TPA: hypothetical protein VEK08_22770 [Planctomycetota bacterium]|nr:hypothetical protein [Planctomycetota bacterium]
MISQAQAFEQKATAAAEHDSPARSADFIGRLIIAMSVVALLFAFWEPRLGQAAEWTAKELRILPRLSVFVVAGLFTLILQGARPARIVLLLLGAASLLTSFLLLPSVESSGFSQTELLNPVRPSGSVSPAGYTMMAAGHFLALLRLELAVTSALLLGMWLGRDIKNGSQMLSLLLCAIVGDVWLSLEHVTENAPASHALSLLRLPWPPPTGHLGLSPAWTDLLFLGATLEAASRLKLHTLSVVLGAVSGYCAAGFLALEPWPAWPFLTMMMFSSGVMVASWPDMEFKFDEVLRGFILATALLMFLIGLTAIQRRLSPQPEPQIDLSRLKNVTEDVRSPKAKWDLNA